MKGIRHQFFFKYSVPFEHAIVFLDACETCHRTRYKTVVYCIDRISVWQSLNRIAHILIHLL